MKKITETINENGGWVQKTLTGEKSPELSRNKKNKDKKRGLKRYPEVRNWLRNKSEKTKKSYLYALAHFTEFVGKSPPEQVEEVRKRNLIGEKEQGLIELKIIQFYDWLTEEKPKEKPLECGKRIVYTGEEGLSEETANNYISAIRSFFYSNECALKDFEV